MHSGKESRAMNVITHKAAMPAASQNKTLPKFETKAANKAITNILNSAEIRKTAFVFPVRNLSYLFKTQDDSPAAAECFHNVCVMGTIGINARLAHRRPSKKPRPTPAEAGAEKPISVYVDGSQFPLIPGQREEIEAGCGAAFFLNKKLTGYISASLFWDTHKNERGVTSGEAELVAILLGLHFANQFRGPRGVLSDHLPSVNLLSGLRADASTTLTWRAGNKKSSDLNMAKTRGNHIADFLAKDRKLAAWLYCSASKADFLKKSLSGNQSLTGNSRLTVPRAVVMS